MGMIVRNVTQVLAAIAGQVEKAEWQTQQILMYAGEEFIRRAKLVRLNKSHHSYKDQTGNLTSSIGYIVAKDKKIIVNAIVGVSEDGKQTEEGRVSGIRLAKMILADYPQGWVLIGVAGMSYGIFVEARGYDVISSSIPPTQKLINQIIEEVKK